MQEVTHLLQKENFSRLGHAEKRRVKQRCVRLLIVGDWDDFFRDLMCEPNRVPRAWACPRRRDVFVGIFFQVKYLLLREGKRVPQLFSFLGLFSHPLKKRIQMSCSVSVGRHRAEGRGERRGHRKPPGNLSRRLVMLRHQCPHAPFTLKTCTAPWSWLSK